MTLGGVKVDHDWGNPAKEGIEFAPTLTLTVGQEYGQLWQYMSISDGKKYAVLHKKPGHIQYISNF